MTDDPYVDEVRRKAERIARARRERRSVWTALGRAGTFGWQLVLPLLAGTFGGSALARTTGYEPASLIGIGLGLVFGLWTAGWGLASSLAAGEREDP